MGEVMRSWMGQPGKARANREKQEQLSMQQENANTQKAAQQKQIEVQQNQQAAQDKDIAGRSRQRRGSRLLMAAETGFGGVKSTLG